MGGQEWINPDLQNNSNDIKMDSGLCCLFCTNLSLSWSFGTYEYKTNYTTRYMH